MMDTKQEKRFTMKQATPLRNFGQEKQQRLPQQEKIAFSANEELKTLAVKVPTSLIDQINDYGFWEALNQSDVVVQALQEFLSSREIKPMPEAHKKKMEQNARKRQQGMRKRKAF